MQYCNISPDNYTYPILIQACALQFTEIGGTEIHGHVLKIGFGSSVYVRNTLINMYALCGCIKDARQVFDESPVLDSVSWNSMLEGYVRSEDIEAAKELYDLMPEKGIIAANSMIVLFGKLGRVVEARQFFDEMREKDKVSWSALISCYEKNEFYCEALSLFEEMVAGDILLDEVVLVSVISACTHLNAIQEGRRIHGLAIKIGVNSCLNLSNACIQMYARCGDLMGAENIFYGSHNLDKISWNSMISGYVKCGFLHSAWSVFENMPEKDLVSWTSMISGYAQHNLISETLKLFQEMQQKGISPDEVVIATVISACTNLAALDIGKSLHSFIRKKGFKMNGILVTTLIDMYVKCGCVENAVEVFHEAEEKEVSVWNAIILGFSMNGFAERALELFSEMKKCRVVPNEITFTGVLGACRHMGLVDEGQRHFNSMVREHGIEPNVKHYGCMVDLLGRAGYLKEAEQLVMSMPMQPEVTTWGALLGACRKHGDIIMGERVARKLIELHPENEGFRVMLSNVYASKGDWNDVLETWQKMGQYGTEKTPGWSLVERNG
ncbi:hypothetical protein RDABS01_023036 [Bienertia sinuspersici]